MARQMTSRQFTSRWFRMYDEALDDPKIKLLTDKQHRFWFECLCLASRNDGFLPPLSHISFSTRRSPEVAARLLQELVDRGLIDSRSADEAQTNCGRYAPHNWSKRQYKSDTSTERVNKMRELRKNETVLKRPRNGHETADVTGPDTDTETEEPPKPPATGVAGKKDRPSKDRYNQNHDSWYSEAYWCHKGKAESRKAYEKAINLLHDRDGMGYGSAHLFLMAKAKEDRERFEHTPDWDWRVNLHPATWLRGQRWTDESTPTNGNGNYPMPSKYVKV